MSRPRLVSLCLLAAPSALVLVTSTRPAQAFCPSYSPDSTHNTGDCGVASANGTNPTTAEWLPIFDLVSQGPSVWGNQGPTVPDIGQGCGHPEALHSVPARFPCELLKGIAQQESSWIQFCVPDQPADEVGGASRTLISFDCGYGVGQVTSGMHKTDTADFDRARVASDPTYNLATGTRILASKWKATNCVGDNQPTLIEDWYTSTWAYNGLAYVNNPSNPNYDAHRGVWNPSTGGAAPYQEKVFGHIEYTGGKWTATKLAYPNPGDVGGTGSPPDLDEPDCASPTDCTDHRSTHPTSCGGTTGTGGGSAASSSSAGATSASSSTAGSGGAFASSAEASSGAGNGGAAGTGGHGGAAGTGGEGGGGGAPATGGHAARGSSSSGDLPLDEDKGGCGCRAAGASSSGSTAALAVTALALAIARSRKRRGGPPCPRP